MPHPALIAVVAILVSLALLAERFLHPRPIIGIPHNPITSRWGDALAAQESVEKCGDMFEDEALGPRMVRALGPISQLLIGPLTMLLVCDAREYEDLMLRSRSKCFEQAETTRLKIGVVIPKGMVTLPTDEMWKRHRKMSAPLMGSKYLGGMAEPIARNARILIDFWKSKAAKVAAVRGRCFPCSHDLSCSTLDTISCMVIGRSIESLPYEAAQLPTAKINFDVNNSISFNVQHHPLYNAFRYFLPFQDMSVMIPRWFISIYAAYVTWRPSYRRNYRTLVNFIDQCTEERRAEVREARSIGAEPEAANSFIGIVIEKELEGGQTQDIFTQRELQDECLSFFFAGHDTTSGVLQWAIKYFTNAPDVQRRLREELRSALDNSPEDRLLTYADVTSDRTPFLEAVVHEVLRCARVAQGTSRTTCDPVDILGHPIPAGTEVVFMNSVACRMATKKSADRFDGCGFGLWDDNDVATFNPSQWLDAEGKFNLKAGYSFPFGLGVRSCAGKQLALLELRMYIAMLNLAFFFDKIPEPLNDFRPVNYGLSLIPVYSYVAPRSWSGVA